MDSIDASLQKGSSGFISSLVSAVHEWMVILMLVIDAVFSFIITKCAHFWKLCPPCLLCSRLDHVFSDEKNGYLWDLICRHHKKEISSLVFCHTHNKLVDVHGLCENCLFSFATINKSNAETYRLLVGKLGEDPFSRFDDLSHENLHNGAESKSRCSCCFERWAPRLPRKLIESRSIGFEAAELDTPVSTPFRLNKEDDKKVNDNRVESRSTHRRNLGIDNLSHIGYRELKISSDTESEVQFSEEEDYSPLVLDKDESRLHLEIKDVPRECRVITLGDVFPSEKLIKPTSAEEPLDSASPMSLEELSDLASPTLLEEPVILVPQLLADDTHSLGGESGEISRPIGHGLQELNWEQPAKTHPPPKTDLISLPDSADLCTIESKHELDVTNCSDGDGAETVDPNNGVTISTLPSETILRETIPVPNDQGGPLVPNLLELGDAYMLAISDRGRQISSLLTEQWIGKDSSKVGEDLRMLFSQLSVSRGVEQAKNEVTPSPRISVTIDEVKTTDGLQVLQKRISLERNESGLSTDGSIVSEIEGEGVIDRLKRQIDHDKKLMSSLYKELEEERNASAIAANQAMAMITRLQEEKATLNMEALQYLRMMEEQTEYDNEALQKANDILAEKEKELQDMEDELEYYRNKYPHESVLEIDGEIHDMNARDIGTVPLDSSQADRNSSNPEIVDKDVEDENDSSLDFESERRYITQRLKKLEKMHHLFSNNGIPENPAKGEDISEREMENSELDENADRENSQNQERASPSENCGVEKEDVELHHTAQSSPSAGRKIEITSFENEIFNLNKRLELIEADREFLKHAVTLLGNQETGLGFIQEIASHLRELRKSGVRSDLTTT